MKHFSLIIICAGIFNLHAGKTSQQMLELHQEIGKELLAIRNEAPQLQPRAFALIDKAGSLYRLAQETTKKKKNYKKAFHEQLALLKKIKQENTQLRTTLMQFRPDLKPHDTKQAQVQKNTLTSQAIQETKNVEAPA